jgi:hypothetical protein
MLLADDLQDSPPVHSTSLWLLCLPCWILGFYALLVITVTKLAPAYMHIVVSKKFTFVPAIVAIASPFLWLVVVWKLIGRYRRTGLRVPGTWSFVLISGIVMIATWVLLLHFSHR